MVLGKELRRFPERAVRELHARSAAASVAVREGASVVFALEAHLRGADRSGSAIVAECLRELGVAPGRVVRDDRTRSTREEAVEGLREARQHGVDRLTVLTHGYHVPRVRSYFAELFAPGAYRVLTPEAYLQRARGLEREWIEAATPDEAVYGDERIAELVLGGLATALRPLPRSLRYRLEIQAAGAFRYVS